MKLTIDTESKTITTDDPSTSIEDVIFWAMSSNFNGYSFHKNHNPITDLVILPDPLERVEVDTETREYVIHNLISNDSNN